MWRRYKGYMIAVMWGDMRMVYEYHIYDGDAAEVAYSMVSFISAEDALRAAKEEIDGMEERVWLG